MRTPAWIRIEDACLSHLPLLAGLTAAAGVAAPVVAPGLGPIVPALMAGCLGWTLLSVLVPVIQIWAGRVTEGRLWIRRLLSWHPWGLVRRTLAGSLEAGCSLLEGDEPAASAIFERLDDPAAGRCRRSLARWVRLLVLERLGARERLATETIPDEGPAGFPPEFLARVTTARACLIEGQDARAAGDLASAIGAMDRGGWMVCGPLVRAFLAPVLDQRAEIVTRVTNGGEGEDAARRLLETMDRVRDQVRCLPWLGGFCGWAPITTVFLLAAGLVQLAGSTGGAPGYAATGLVVGLSTPLHELPLRLLAAPFVHTTLLFPLAAVLFWVLAPPLERAVGSARMLGVMAIGAVGAPLLARLGTGAGVPGPASADGAWFSLVPLAVLAGSCLLILASSRACRGDHAQAALMGPAALVLLAVTPLDGSLLGLREAAVIGGLLGLALSGPTVWNRRRTLAGIA